MKSLQRCLRAHAPISMRVVTNEKQQYRKVSTKRNTGGPAQENKVSKYDKVDK